LDRAIELIKAKREADANKLIKSFPGNDEIQVLNGRFGPYIKAGKKNVKIPKGKDPKELTLEECIELAANAPEKRGRFGRYSAPAKAAETPAKSPAKKAAKKDVAVAEAPAKKAAVKKAPAKKIAAKKTPAKKTAVKKKK
jgi:DNA topoisomerase-1